MKQRKQNTGFFIFLSLLVIINLAVLLYLKYYLNDLPINIFRLDYAGNLINVTISLLIIAGIIVHHLSPKNIDKRKLVFLLSAQLLILLSYGFIFLLARFNLTNPAGYLFNFPVKKVYTGFLFVFSVILQIYSLLYLWGLIFGSENLFEIRTLIRVIAVVLLLLVFSLFNVWNVRAYDEKKIESTVFEYGCIPGAAVWSRGKPSPIFEGRIRKAFELYKKGLIKNIILTGGNAPGEISESEAAYKYLRNLDIKKKNLRLETQSSTTTLQIKFLHSKYSGQQDHKPILIISDGFHLTRITQIAKFFNLDVVGVSSDYSMSFDKTIFYRARESVALLLFWLFAI